MALNATMTIPAPPEQKQPPLPPLQSGDYLSRSEFERRYETMPAAKAELIEGVVYMASPVYFTHGRYHSFAIHWLSAFVDNTPGLEIADNVSTRLGNDSEV